MKNKIPVKYSKEPSKGHKLEIQLLYLEKIIECSLLLENKSKSLHLNNFHKLILFLPITCSDNSLKIRS